MSEPTPTEPIATAKSNATATITPTSYAILRKDDEGHWEHLDGHDGYSGEAAIRAFIADKLAGDPAGTYVAVPARSWKPVQVSAVQTTVLKIEEAK